MKNGQKKQKKPDGPDWCDEAIKRVKEGSDGLWIRLQMGSEPIIAMNPFVSLGATIVLFGFIIYCATSRAGDHCMELEESPDGLRMVAQYFKCNAARIEFDWAKTWVSKVWTWLYIATQDAWAIFAVVICFTKYGKLKCGPDDEPPEFTFFSYFAMIFSCGVAAGLFFYSVAETLFHYEPCWGPPNEAGPAGHCTADKQANRYSHSPDNLRAQQAMHLTLYHWGVHGWICYSLVGCVLALLHYRKGLPMTMKSALYPLFGMRVYGFFGDVLDIFSVVGTTFGVCTTLGLATVQLSDGIKRRNGGNHWLGLGFYSQDNFNEWSDNLQDYKGIWDMATPTWKEANPWFDDSGGVNVGSASIIANLIKNNDQELLIIWIITAISTTSLLAGMHYGIQFVGNFTFIIGCFLMFSILIMDDTWYILNFWCQSFGYYFQHVIDTSFYTGAHDSPEHSYPEPEYGEYGGWMNDWTIYYWGWWIAWGPSIGTFLARISKGRTIREFMGCCVFGSTAFNYIWLITFSGAGLKMEMAAKKAGLVCDNPTANVCREESVDRYTGEPHYICSTLTRLSCLGATDMLPSLLEQYSDIGIFLCFLTLIACTLYFVASSDSGSLVDSMLSSNGMEEPPRIQRFYWSLTEGAASSALLYTGRFTPQAGDGSLKALQAMSIAVGFPWTFICSFLCISLWRACQYEMGDRKWGNGFRSSIIDIGVTAWNPKPLEGTGCNFALGSVDLNRVGKTLLNSTCPPATFFRIYGTLEARKTNPKTWLPGFMAVVTGILYWGWFIMCLVDYIPVDHGGYWTKGSLQGTADSTQRISNRYGIFYGWTERGKAGLVVKERNTTSAAWTMAGMTYYPDHLEDIPVGDELGTDGRFGVFAWFMWLLFIGVLTQTRNNVRLMYKKHGNLLEDFLCTCVAWPMVLTQVLETLEEEEVPRDPLPDEDPYAFGDQEYEEDEQIPSPQKGKNGHGNGNGSHQENGNHDAIQIGPDPAMVQDLEDRFEEAIKKAEARLELKAAKQAALAAQKAHKFSAQVMPV